MALAAAFEWLRKIRFDSFSFSLCLKEISEENADIAVKGLAIHLLKFRVYVDRGVRLVCRIRPTGWLLC